MDEHNSLLVLLMPVLLTILAFPCASVLATTDQDEGEVITDVSESGAIDYIPGYPVGTVENNSQPVNITIDTAYFPDDLISGDLTVTGDVENGLSRSIHNVQVTGTFYDANYNVLGTASTLTGIDGPSPPMMGSIEPGDRQPFWLDFGNDAVNLSEIATYKLKASWQESQD